MRMKKFAALLAACALVLGAGGCSAARSLNHQEMAVSNTVTTGCSAKMKAEQSKMGIAWYRTSGEAKALYYQGYALGKMAVDQSLREKVKKKRAIVLDLDETVLDNGPYLSYMAQKGISFGDGWGQWVKKAEAGTLPGALEFLKYADAKGIDIYYISNRSETYLDATLKNLRKEGIPQATASHVLLRKDTASKEERRLSVERNHEIIALFGDNLTDFEKKFDNKEMEARNQDTVRFHAEFGRKFIVFPNPVYGDWDNGIPCS
ncbi:5'-nucleotidase, lipoprotein e(P4) family [Heyndrickxia acidiproducens]|uniref:5'-nucleotidase, lipoprotein e(P4) family n=1 Tax=Heyndrickxia acidiproducens TaxID=1121084 RepID=UPI00036C2EBE|nr:5'-nucleotidase, lipoprotein e(P4) family [Heyndrickxia acidiproducens]